MNRLVHGLVTLVAGIGLLVGCGGGATDDDAGSAAPLRVVVEPNDVVVRQSQSVTVRVDTPDAAEGDLPSGFAFDLDEVAGRIDVTTAPCPSGTGSSACRQWTITPRADSVPGEYDVGVHTVGSRRGTGRRSFHLVVVAAPRPDYGAAVAVRADGDSVLVINGQGQVYARGSNYFAQVRFGYLRMPFAGGSDHAAVEPGRVSEFVAAPLPSGQRWLGVDLYLAKAFAVRDDGAGAGSVFAWGINSGDLGFPPDPQVDFQATPREVPGIANVRAVSTNNGYGTLALLADGRALNWSGDPEDREFVCERHHSGDPTQCAVMTDVVATAGSGITAVVLRSDGSVWHLVDYPDDAVPVPGLAGPMRAIAAAKIPSPSHNVALARDGSVWTWTRTNRATVTPAVMAGLDDVIAISAYERRQADATVAYAAALRSDGTVWQWRFDAAAPSQVAGITNAIHVADGYVITGDCTVGGSLWRIEADGRAVRVPGFGEGQGCAPVAMVDVEIAVTGQGRVVSAPSAIDCGSECRASFARNTELRLHAVPEPGWRLSSWRGEGCAEVVVPATNLRCEAVFAPGGNRRLSVRVSAGGAVVSEPAGIACGDDCGESFPVGSTVTLRAVAAPGFRFANFDGDDDCADGALVMRDATACSASFAALPAPAAPTGLAASAVPNAVNLSWDSGNGEVIRYKLERAGPAGPFETINSAIPGTSTAHTDGSAAPSTTYTYRLTATNLGGSSAPAQVSVTTLAATRATLTLNVSGNGTVSSMPSGISCSASTGDCSEAYPINTQVSLAATPGAGWRLSAFGGDADCADGVVTMATTLACSVTFAPVTGQGWVQLGGAPLTRSGVVPVASLAVDAGQVPHVAYLEAVPAGDVARLRVQRFDGAAWQPMGSALNAGSITPASQPSLAFSPAGVLHLAWSQGNGIQQNVFVARYNGVSWQAVGAPGVPLNYVAGSRATGPSLAFDAGGAPMVAWIEDGAVKFKRWSGVAWVRAQGAGSAEGPPSNAADRVQLSSRPAGVPVLAWTEGSGSERALRVVRDFDFAPLGARVNAPLAAGTTLGDFGVLAGIPDAVATVVWVERSTSFTVRASRWDGQWIPFATIVNASPDTFASLAMAREEPALALSTASSGGNQSSLQVAVRANGFSFAPFGAPLTGAASGALSSLALTMAGITRPIVAGTRLTGGDLYELHVYGYFP